MKLVEVYTVVLKREGCDPQKLVLIDSGQLKLGFAHCPFHDYYQLVPGEHIPSFERAVKGAKPKYAQTATLIAKPVFDSAAEIRKGLGDSHHLASLVNNLLELLNLTLEE